MRMARCGCGEERPSSPDLAFFEFQGPGSHHAEERCKHCFYSLTAHLLSPVPAHLVGQIDTHEFEPRGDVGYDRFYCGCRGWD